MELGEIFFENGDLSLACSKVACDNLEIALGFQFFLGSDRGWDELFINVPEVVIVLGEEDFDVLLSQDVHRAEWRLLQTVGQTRDS